MTELLSQIIGNTTVLELTAGVTYFFGHMYLAKEKYYGWILRIIGAIC